VIRHEHTPNFPNEWNKGSVELIRVDGPPNPEGKCNSTEDGPFTVSSLARLVFCYAGQLIKVPKT